MKKYLFLCLLGITSLSFGQSLSNYKYVLVPSSFSFQKEAHQYNLNRLTQFLLNKYDFEAFIEGEDNDRLNDIEACELLRLKGVSKGAFVSKITFSFLDCKGKTIYISKEGISRKKEFKDSYIEAVRNVFKDKVINTHKYSKKEKVITKKVIVEKKEVIENSIQPEDKVDTLEFELRGKLYSFIPISKTTFSIVQKSKTIGKATKQNDSNIYVVKAGTLSGVGEFDDFGNFTLKRVNPANQKELIDIMARVK